jgi:hypothetical protein
MLQKLNPKTGEDTGEDVTLLDVYQELNDHIADRFKILKFKSRVSSFYNHFLEFR